MTRVLVVDDAKFMRVKIRDLGRGKLHNRRRSGGR